MRFIFARHGESTTNTERVISNRNDEHGLTETGVQQAKTLASRLSAEKVVRLYTSPLLRARQTSSILAKALNAPVLVEDALREFDCGDLEGRGDESAWNEFLELFQDWLAGKRREVAMCGGESFRDISGRFMPFMMGLMQANLGTEGSLLLVSHGGLLYTMLPLLLENITFQYASSRIMTNTSIVIAEEREGRMFGLEWCDERIEDAR
jgi:broad specificity phosphatase PhoE